MAEKIIKRAFRVISDDTQGLTVCARARRSPLRSEWSRSPDKDRYGRTVGRVFVGSHDVNAEMVRRGFAWWYRTYAKKAVDLASAETEAKNAGRGLWADKAPVPPWEFRKKQPQQG